MRLLHNATLILLLSIPSACGDQLGTIMADQSITMAAGATLNGRVLARIAAVSLDSNTIVMPAL